MTGAETVTAKQSAESQPFQIVNTCIIRRPRWQDDVNVVANACPDVDFSVGPSIGGQLSDQPGVAVRDATRPGVIWPSAMLLLCTRAEFCSRTE